MAHERIARALDFAVDEGRPLTWAEVARIAGLSRVRLYQIRRRYPGLEPWLSKRAREQGERRVGLIIDKFAAMALRGSVAHAETLLKLLNGGMVPGGAPAGQVNNFNGPTIVKLGVPGPGEPLIAAKVES